MAGDFELIRTARDGRDNYAEDWEEYEEIYRNVWDDEKAANAKKFLRTYSQSPIVYDTLQIKLSIFSSSFQSSPFPVVIDGYGDVGSAVARQLRLAGGMMWKRSSPFVALNKAMLRMLVFNVGVLLCYWDKDKKKIVVREINPMDISFDPAAATSDDVQYYAYDRYMTKNDVLRMATPRGAKGKKKTRYFNRIKKIADVLPEYDSSDKENFNGYERMKLVELYVLQEDGKWNCKTYVDETEVLVHEQTFDRSPFSWGYAIDSLSSVNEDDREEELHMYGGSEAKNLKPYADDMMHLKNQFSDILEEEINPSVYVGSKAKVNASMLKRGAGTKISVGDPTQIKERRAPSMNGVLEAMDMAKSDVEDTSAINGFYKAQTSASDRRSTGAIALLEAKASTRIEMQILTAKETLYDHFVQNFMALVFKHAPKSLMRMVNVEDVLIGSGVSGKPNLKDVVSVEFGADMDKDRRYASYMEAAQVMGQFKDANPRTAEMLVEEALKIKVGDRVSLPDGLFDPIEPAQPAPIPEEVVVDNLTEGVPGGI